MPLLQEDIQRISGLGFKKDSFSIESKGFVLLKNSDEGRCVFHDGKQCTIYESRPTGCKLYPIVFDEESGRPGKDTLCPYRGEFPIPLSSKQELHKVYRSFVDESKERKTGHR